MYKTIDELLGTAKPRGGYDAGLKNAAFLYQRKGIEGKVDETPDYLGLPGAAYPEMPKALDALRQNMIPMARPDILPITARNYLAVEQLPLTAEVYSNIGLDASSTALSGIVDQAYLISKQQKKKPDAKEEQYRRNALVYSK